MTLTGPACVSHLAKLMIGISLPTLDLGFKTWVCAHLVGREPVMRKVVLILNLSALAHLSMFEPLERH
jgi:hypothetical protein